jgi:hypothetical protein
MVTGADEREAHRGMDSARVDEEEGVNRVYLKPPSPPWSARGRAEHADKHPRLLPHHQGRLRRAQKQQIFSRSTGS